jgi:hypothetical protein
MIDGGSGNELPFQSAWVTPTDGLKQLVEANMIQIDNDTISYKMIIFKDVAVLHVHYGLIIGGFVAGEIALDSIPDWIRTKPDTE